LKVTVLLLSVDEADPAPGYLSSGAGVRGASDRYVHQNWGSGRDTPGFSWEEVEPWRLVRRGAGWRRTA
jgi:hypothetical protein